MSSTRPGHRARTWASITTMMALVACGGGSAAPAESPSPPPAPTPAPVMSTLTVSTTSGGSVTATPDGSACTSSCRTDYLAGTAVTLSAQAVANYQFDGWSSGCTGSMPTCRVTLSESTSVSATFVPVVPQPGSPFVQFTDALSGPVTGGENDQGAYLSIFGTNFGSAATLGSTTKVFIGGVEVANYRYLGPAKVAGKLGLQQLTVQVGHLGDPTLGTPEPIKIVVGNAASNTNHTFTPNPGRVLFVSLSGDDASAVANDIAHPWRHLQTPAGGGLAAILQAGDHVVIRGGHWTDIGFDSSWFRFRYPNQEGTAPTGAAKTGWIQFTAYPGAVNGNAIEDVHYSTPAGMKGGIQGANSAYYGTTGDYVSISNLRMDVDANATSDAAPINVQYSAGPWRVVNNELGPWPAAIHSLAAGVSGHGDGNAVLGNHIHDIACVGALENHGIYADSGAMNWSIGFNWIHDITGGNLIQFYDNVGLAGNTYTGFPSGWNGFTGMMVFNNWLENSGKYGLNMADGIVSGHVWNNVVKGASFAGLRFNTISKNMDMTVAFNTFYDNDRVAVGGSDAQVLNTWGNYNPTGTIRIYDNIIAAGPKSVRSSSFYRNVGNTDSYLDFRRNLYYDNGYGWGSFARDASAIVGNPLFIGAASDDFSLSATSPAIDAGTQATALTLVQDFTGRVSRPSGSVSDLGAFEFVH